MKKETRLIPSGRDPFGVLQDLTSEMQRFFDDTMWPAFTWPALRSRPASEVAAWTPRIEVFEKDNRLVTRIDLPGLKKDEIKVEVVDGYLTISGERKREAEEKKENFYRCEREYGSFYRSVPLPDGVKLDDVKASFADGVLEVSAPLPAQAQQAAKTIEIKDAGTSAKSAA